jgi:uncharacterized membrane protein YdjX (TVP38/TMEM64 family)
MGLLDYRELFAYFGVMTAAFSFLSIPPSLPTLYFAKAGPPWLIALLASLGAAAACVIDYYVVRRVFRFAALERVRGHRYFDRFERWAKVAPFWTTVAFAALPLPYVLPRVLMPLSGYPLRRYMAAAALGRYPRVFVVAAFGEAFEIPREILLALFVAGMAVTGTTALVRHLREQRRSALWR